MTKKTVIRVVCFAVMGLLFAAVLAGNIVASHFSDLITEYFHGAGISYEGEAVENALQYSDQLCREMTEEGIVLLENKETDGKAALPLTEDEAKNINVFGRWDYLTSKNDWNTEDDCMTGLIGAEFKLGKYIKLAPNFRIKNPTADGAENSYYAYLNCSFSI